MSIYKYHNADLKLASLFNANLEEAVLNGANLSDSDLRHVNFTNTQLELVNFSGSRVKGALFTDAIGLTLQQKQWLKKNGALNISDL
ncbi:MAG: pentapeptide repeat-containing protein [Nostoc sp.]|uniref:pentapeptide repeat-containing protein n=1 Tax=Nostoc sp. TaxID=1180 RepID=UPI002FFB35DE